MRLDKEYNSLRDELARFRVEIRQRLETLEGQLNKQIQLNYSRTVIDYLSRFTNSFINSMKCEYDPGYEKTCKEKMLSMQSEYIDLLKSGKLFASQGALQKVIDESKTIREVSLSNGRNGCVKCFDSEISGLEINLILLSQLLELERPHLGTDESAAIISEIDPIQLDEKILNPLSHQARLAIMISIYAGENRFTDFIRKTGLTGGHLGYHLKKLEENGFIQQFASKEYVLTSKGLNSLVMIANLNSVLK